MSDGTVEYAVTAHQSVSPSLDDCRVTVLTIPGRPVPAARMTRRGKWIKPQAQRYLAFKEHVGFCARQYFPEPLRDPIAVEIDCYMAGGVMPDVDNVAKAVMDGMNGIAWLDDRQVVDLRIRRLAGRPQRTEIRVFQISAS